MAKQKILYMVTSDTKYYVGQANRADGAYIRLREHVADAYGGPKDGRKSITGCEVLFRETPAYLTKVSIIDFNDTSNPNAAATIERLRDAYQAFLKEWQPVRSFREAGTNKSVKAVKDESGNTVYMNKSNQVLNLDQIIGDEDDDYFLDFCEMALNVSQYRRNSSAATNIRIGGTCTWRAVVNHNIIQANNRDLPRPMQDLVNKIEDQLIGITYTSLELLTNYNKVVFPDMYRLIKTALAYMNEEYVNSAELERRLNGVLMNGVIYVSENQIMANIDRMIDQFREEVKRDYTKLLYILENAFLIYKGHIRLSFDQNKFDQSFKENFDQLRDFLIDRLSLACVQTALRHGGISGQDLKSALIYKQVGGRKSRIRSGQLLSSIKNMGTERSSLRLNKKINMPVIEAFEGTLPSDHWLIKVENAANLIFTQDRKKFKDDSQTTQVKNELKRGAYEGFKRAATSITLYHPTLAAQWWKEVAPNTLMDRVKERMEAVGMLKSNMLFTVGIWGVFYAQCMTIFQRSFNRVLRADEKNDVGTRGILVWVAPDVPDGQPFYQYPFYRNTWRRILAAQSMDVLGLKYY